MRSSEEIRADVRAVFGSSSEDSDSESSEEVIFPLFDSDDDNESVATDETDPYDEVKDNVNWVSYLQSLSRKTQEQYVKRARDFLMFQKRHRGDERLAAVVLAYFEDRKAALNNDGRRQR